MVIMLLKGSLEMKNKFKKSTSQNIIFIIFIAFVFYLDTKPVIDRIWICMPIVVVVAYIWLDNKFKGKQYSCIFRKDIYPYNKDFDIDVSYTPAIILKRKIKLNIVPAIGMRISHYGEDVHEDFFSEQIEKIHYINSANNFECVVTPLKMTKKNDLTKILEGHFEKGWNIVDGSQEVINIFDKWTKN